VSLPGTDEPFVLKKYREDVGKAYQRITLFIARKTDFLFAEISSTLWDSDDQSDNELLAPLLSIVHPSQSPEPAGVEEQPADPTGSTVEVIHLDVTCSSNSTMPIAPSTSASHTQQLPTRMVECPHCFQFYSIENIADHAHLCIDDWVGEVVLPVQADSAQDSDAAEQMSDVSLKDVLLSLIEDHVTKDEGKTLCVRRRYLWEDFKAAKRKCKLSPSSKIRIIFIGEPAIDDGGPTREFLSSMYAVPKLRFLITLTEIITVEPC
jgi:hypothetical protein